METKVITIDDKWYPDLLKEIQAPPKKLYFRGNIELLKTRCVSVAGSRRASPEGLRAAGILGKRLAGCGITVVSGLAEGVDAEAHKGALLSGGNTIAVLANGLDRFYPVSNRGLQKEIEMKGLLISEYPDGIGPMRHFFPKRNRIISGLSEITVIAEAALKSGSLITAEAAAEQGRDVYAVTGNFAKECCAGTNRLIIDGALPLIDVNVFLRDIGAEAEEEKAPENLSSEEEMVYDTVRRFGEVTAGDIARETLIPERMVNGIITVLEIKGLVQTEMGRTFLAMGRL